MTEDEKKRLVLEFFAQETARLSSRTATVLDVHSERIQTNLARSERQRRLLDGLAQNGISWDQLKSTFDEAVERGKDDMIQLNIGYFYNGMAIALKEAAPASTTDAVPHASGRGDFILCAKALWIAWPVRGKSTPALAFSSGPSGGGAVPGAMG